MSAAPLPTQLSAAANPPAAPVVPWSEAWREECDALGIDPSEQPTALCLSGGGIRSASFSLGVLQALAEAGLLRHFHYLSTVSGGGYIGGWLTRLIAAQGDTVAQGTAAGPVDLAAIEATLKPGVGDGLASEEIRNLRSHTRYLAPRPGLASPDLWAGVMLWLRNTLINWLVFVPLLLCVVGLPFAYAGGIAFLASQSDAPWMNLLQAAGAGLSLILLVWIIRRTILWLPTHSHPPARTDPQDYGKGNRRIVFEIVFPVILWCLLVPATVAPSMGLQVGYPWKVASPSAATAPAEPGRSTVTGGNVAVTRVPESQPVPTAPGPQPADLSPTWVPYAVAAAIMIASLLAYVLAFIGALPPEHVSKGTQEYDYYREQSRCFVSNLLAWFIACTGSAALVGLGIYLGAGSDALWVIIGGPLWMMLAEVIRSTLYVAFRVRALRGDLDREWLARLSGTKFVIVLAMAAVAALALIAPAYVLIGPKSWLTVLSGGVASGSAAAVLGKSALTAFSARRADGTRWVGPNVPIALGIILFIAGLIVVAAGVFDSMLHSFGASKVVTGYVAVAFGEDFRGVSEMSSGLLSLIVAASAGYLALWLGGWINLNNFSMHAVYRNRLVRGFLGSARRRYVKPGPNGLQPANARRPDRYTGFDPADDIRMADAFNRGEPRGTATRAPPRLVPVVNVTLNATAGTDPSRAERQAESFTITPFRCGSAALPLPGRTTPAGATAPGAYALTSAYAGMDREAGPGDAERGISLGTAVAISGAAASPNMGYHSSPLVAFVMTLFNVRLGAWLPNPGASADERFLRRPDPDGLGSILWDLMGRSRLDDRYVYLSDGGHFDNLALYEMLRRRCRLMVVVDAGQDEAYDYADLRIAIQNASVDLGVRLKFPDGLTVGRNLLDPFGTIATVVYPACTGPDGKGRSEEDGLILYLKPWLPDDSPTELRAFKAFKASFPHESTGNQFFKESDFESYRALGAFIGRQALRSYHADDPGQRGLRPGEHHLDRLVACLKR